MPTRSAALLIVALVAIACGAPTDGQPVATSPSVDTSIEIARCDEVPRVYAPDDWYDDEPVYVGNEMPVDEVRDWASGQPGFEDVWIDRDRRGWISVAFSGDAPARQADLEERFPEVGVVAVPVDWTLNELMELQRRVMEELGGNDGASSGISVTQGVVSIGFGVLTDARLAAVAEEFAGERVCVEGADPADVPAQRPQQTSGHGWRLLADEPETGDSYRTGIAADEISYERLWDDIGLSGPRPEVDFQSEVVVWFGAVYGSSCPNLRLDDVVVDRRQALVHAEIVLVDPPAACTDDAVPHAYVVAVERSRLPQGPFALQLEADDPPAVVSVLVDTDLSRPGAVAAPGQIRPDDAPPESSGLGSGDIMETGYPRIYRMDVRCGIEWLGILNHVAWRTDVSVDAADRVPVAWRNAVTDDGHLDVEVIIEPGSPPTATALANGHEVVYVPAEASPPTCE